MFVVKFDRLNIDIGCMHAVYMIAIMEIHFIHENDILNVLIDVFNDRGR